MFGINKTANSHSSLTPVKSVADVQDTGGRMELHNMDGWNYGVREVAGLRQMRSLSSFSSNQKGHRKNMQLYLQLHRWSIIALTKLIQNPILTWTNIEHVNEAPLGTWNQGTLIIMEPLVEIRIKEPIKQMPGCPSHGTLLTYVQPRF